MKKILIVFLLVLIVCGLIPFNKQTSIDIRANYFEVSQQLSNADNWLKWQPEIKKNSSNRTVKTGSSGFEIKLPGQTFETVNKRANIFVTKRNISGMAYIFYYMVAPGSKNNYTTVIVNYKLSAMQWLVYQLSGHESALNPIADLKLYMENPLLYYGFDIREKEVNEKYVVVTGKLVATANRYTKSAKMVEQLKSYLQLKHLNATQPVMAQYTTQGTDSLKMMLGIPVIKKVENTDAFSCMRIPGGKIVSAVYHGQYKDRTVLYAAMEKYIQNHSLQKQITPFENYLDNKIPLADNDMVNMQVIFPVL